MQLPLNKRRYSVKLLFVLLIFGLLYGCHKEDHFPPKANEESADVVYKWYKLLAVIQLPTNPQPIVILNNRNFGFIGVGLYEAVRPGIKDAVSLSSKLYQMPEMPQPEMYKEYSWSAVANAALASMFKQFLAGLSDTDKGTIDSMENVNNDRFKLSISDAALSRSQAFGRAIATAIYNWSTTDNFNLSSVGYTIPVFPGAWEPTPPAYLNPLGPFLKDSRPFLEYSLTATAPSMPVAYSEDPSSEFYKEAKEVYDIGKNLTDEQKAIASWWADAGGTGVGVPAPYHLLSIVTWVLENQNAKLAKAAEVYAKVGIGQKDGFINTFRAKFQYNLIRPVTYIKKQIDTAWMPFLITPPYPEYTSGFVGLYSPVIEVLKREFGDIPVTDDAYHWRGDAPREYNSLTQLIEEGSMSRVYGGLHYPATQKVSLTMGKALGDKIADIDLGSTKY